MGKFRSPLIREEIASRLREARENRRLSQVEMANSVDLSLRAYRNYEQGLRDLPAQVVFAMSARHDIDPAWIYTGSGVGPNVRYGSEGALWRAAVELVARAISEGGITVPEAKRTALYDAVVSYLRQGGTAETVAIAGIIRLAAPA